MSNTYSFVALRPHDEARWESSSRKSLNQGQERRGTVEDRQMRSEQLI